MVWAHHMYASGWAPDLNGPFMLTTEMISVPTGVLFLVVIGTLWRGRIWTTLPMMSVYAMLWNFIIGGITGIYLSDVPADYDLHGSMFVTAHFHYTLMGAGLTGAIGALAFWFPKMTGRMLNERAGMCRSGSCRSASTSPSSACSPSAWPGSRAASSTTTASSPPATSCRPRRVRIGIGMLSCCGRS